MQAPPRDGAALQDYSQAILFALLTQAVCLWMSSRLIGEGFVGEAVDITRLLLLLFMLTGLGTSVVAILMLVLRFRSPWLLMVQSLLLGVPLIYYFRGPAI